ncbi:hypothetical protein [Paenibacillus sp. PL2-23]|uniref:hypothetical protein n=1 Tax=Paenibacillus sp. PL2-23 TaxID=2100729 RepID=UPI0030F72C0B
MYMCFAEYRIMPEYRESFLAVSERLVAEEQGRVRLYEGTDQPGLFVEVWEAPSEEEAERVKEERLSGRSSWSELLPFISGGAAKLHVWTFRPVITGQGSTD